MNGYASSRMSLSHEEKVNLLDEKTPSEIDIEASRADLDFRFPVLKWTKGAGVLVEYARTAPWRHLVYRSCLFLLPSFVVSRLSRERTRGEKLMPTAYLDGMRGLAALFVFFCHYTYQSFTIAQGWGSAPNNYHILKLPFLRLWYQGPVAVCVFFVISGYALSLKPLKLIRSRSYEDFSTALTSLTFRRAMRLYLPTMASTFMVVVLLRLGVYEWTRDFAGDRTYMKNVAEPHPERLDSSWEQLTDWAWNMFNFVAVFSWGNYDGSTGYDVHLWTIPVEFRCSLYLFLTILGTARLRTHIRFMVVACIMAFTYRHDHWELLLFFCGMLLAELDLIRKAHAAAPPLLDGEQTTKRRWWPVFWGVLSVVALYLMSQPDDLGWVTPGWVWLTSLIPEWWGVKYRYWQSVGAVIFVLCVGHTPSWQRFFNSAVVQYFGKISYALYLMHGPVMHTVGYMWERWAWGITGVEGYWYNAGFLLGSLFCIPSVIWAADVFWRAVDIPSVKFAKWVEGRCSIRD